MFEQLDEGGGGIRSNKFRAAVGSPPCPLKALEAPTPTRTAAAAPKGKKQEVHADSKLASAVPAQQSGRQRDPEADRQAVVPLIKWRQMTAEELRVLEDQVTRRSSQLFSSLLRASEAEDIRSLSAQTMQLGVISSRLGGQRVREATPKLFFSPSEVTAAATNRSDIIVLPNLKMCLSVKAGLAPPALSSPLSRSLTRGKVSKSPMRLQKTSRVSAGCDQTQSASSSHPEARTSKGWAPGTRTLVL